ncbi:hypothetical protein QAD02_008177 [Eretmocerus hayati]|uniref:Uncharacterized protein n=1 Tax=Eretmocerus hayati TaxID=131215 RepID=A0ACC2N5R4_9HYME|nr:hypothetical protein QAD02_008177 [Eretmocerus hayati]
MPASRDGNNNAGERSLPFITDHIFRLDTVFSIGSQSRKRLATVCETLDVPPLKRDELPHDRFRDKASNTLSAIQNKVVQAMENSFDCEIMDHNVDLKKVMVTNKWHLEMISNMRLKFNNAGTIKDKIEILTFLLSDWTLSNIRSYFTCTKYMYEKMQKLRSDPDSNLRKARAGFDMDPKESIIDHFMDQKNCHTCPRKKESLTVKDPGIDEKEERQKRLLLYTMKELYKNWKKENSHLPKLPGLTFFQSLRPTECVSAGDPGTHTICVCTEHQKVKLKVYALGASLTYRDVMEKVVCNVEDGGCMLRRCKKCPGARDAVEYLTSQTQFNESSTITSKKWIPKVLTEVENRVPCPCNQRLKKPVISSKS